MQSIKKKSEKFYYLLRDNIPEIFEDYNQDILNRVNNLIFDDEKTMFANDIISQSLTNQFVDFVKSKFDKKNNVEIKNNKTAQELLSDVWYDFYHCIEKKDVEQFEKYYLDSEKICTYNNIDDRLNNNHIFWILKKNIKDIKHQWSNKNRQDEYWTSCCSIQINKNNWNISIKNRYNHSVNNCDATFSNNLDNIAMWLHNAIISEYKIKIKKDKNSFFEINWWISNNDKFISYNYEINNIYYWVNKYIKNWELVVLNKDNYIIVDYFIINIKDKKIEIIDNNLCDDFLNIKFKKVVIINDKDNRFENMEDDNDILYILK